MIDLEYLILPLATINHDNLLCFDIVVSLNIMLFIVEAHFAFFNRRVDLGWATALASMFRC